MLRFDVTGDGEHGLESKWGVGGVFELLDGFVVEVVAGRSWRGVLDGKGGKGKRGGRRGCGVRVEAHRQRER